MRDLVFIRTPPRWQPMLPSATMSIGPSTYNPSSSMYSRYSMDRDTRFRQPNLFQKSRVQSICKQQFLSPKTHPRRKQVSSLPAARVHERVAPLLQVSFHLPAKTVFTSVNPQMLGFFSRFAPSHQPTHLCMCFTLQGQGSSLLELLLRFQTLASRDYITVRLLLDGDFHFFTPVFFFPVAIRSIKWQVVSL